VVTSVVVTVVVTTDDVSDGDVDGAVSSLEPHPASRGAAVSAMPIPTVIDHFRMDGQVPLLQVVKVSRFVDIVGTPVRSGRVFGEAESRVPADDGFESSA
jgi:hypothetical protein